MLVNYDFSKFHDNIVKDSSGNEQHGKLFGNASIVNDEHMGEVLKLSGGEDYLQLPNNILKSCKSFSISMFVKINEFITWARLFDFGTTTGVYTFFTPSGFGDNMIWDYNGKSSGVSINAPNIIPLHRWCHLTYTYRDGTAKIYLDGYEVERNTDFYINIEELWSSTKNYIGKSQFLVDSNIEAEFADIRVYSRDLSGNEIEEMISGKLNSDIVEVEELYCNLKVGENFALPKTVYGKTKDGKKVDALVLWNNIDEEFLRKDGCFTVDGRVCGSDIIAKATIDVKSLSISKNYSIDINIKSTMFNNGIRNIKTKFDIVSIMKNNSELVLIVEFYENDKLFDIMREKVNFDGKRDYITVNNLINNSYQDKFYYVNAYVTEVRGLDKIVISVPKIKYIKPLGLKNEVESNNVTLTPDTLFANSQDKGLNYMLRLDADRLLAPIYEALEKKTEAERYGGWEKREIAGHSLGHYLSAMSNFYAVTGNKIAKERMDYVVKELKTLQRDDGYIGGVPSRPFEQAFNGHVDAQAFSLNGFWVPWYSVHKIYAGLIDAYKIGGNVEALNVVIKMADWAYEASKSMTDELFQQMLICEYGGMNEVMADLYSITKDYRYINLAKRFSQNLIIDPLANGINSLQGLHANTQIPKVIGAAKIYELTGDEYYSNASRFFFDMVVNHQSYVIGGNSVSEHFGAKGLEVLTRDTCETCNTYNIMKLAENLFSWDKDSKVIDFYEKSLYNHILASQDPESGAKTYFVSTFPGHFKVYGTDDNSFWCCTGSGMENPGRYNRFIYFIENEDLYINLFIPSSLKIKDRGIDIQQSGNFPYSDETILNINELSGIETIYIRVPYWIDGEMIVTVGSEQYTTNQKGYIDISREWSKGDKVVIKTPMGLHLYESMDSKNKVSYMYGPIVLAAKLGREKFPKEDIIADHLSLMGWDKIDVPKIISENRDIKSYINSSDPEKLEFEISGTVVENGHSIKLVPFYNIHHERYTLYFIQCTDQEYKNGFEIYQSRDDTYEKITIDVVKIGEQQSEIEHDFISENSETGYLSSVDLRWRHAVKGGFFQYTMKSLKDEESALLVTYYDMDISIPEARRDFFIKVNDVVLTEVSLKGGGSDKVIDVIYDLPTDLIKKARISGGRRVLNIRFEPKDTSEFVGGVLEIRTIVKKDEFGIG